MTELLVNAVVAGKKAYREGKKLTENPFTNAEFSKAWAAGWNDEYLVFLEKAAPLLQALVKANAVLTRLSGMVSGRSSIPQALKKIDDALKTIEPQW